MKSMERTVDLRSDTVTQPTDAMREAMARAPVGDDVFGEDPTVNELERRAAGLLDKESAVFLTSGTMGNLVGVLAHCHRGDEVIVGAESHIFWYEAAGTAVVGGLQLRTVADEDGAPQPAAVAAAIRQRDIHFPRTGAVCIENTHNRHGGLVVAPALTTAVAAVARENGLPVHLDGARIFNAAVALGVRAAEIAAAADSVTFCLSKGLSAPVGALLCGQEDYIRQARRLRKMLGGGMRQAGIIAAAGIVALDQMVERLSEDHHNARLLAEGLVKLPGLAVDLERVHTNIVVVRLAEPVAAALLASLATLAVKANRLAEDRIRLVTHYGVERGDVEFAITAFARALEQLDEPCRPPVR